MRKIQGKWDWVTPLIAPTAVVITILGAIAYLVYFGLVVPLSVVGG